MNSIIVIPTYNEVENIKNIIQIIFDDIFKNQEISILVVDSNSSDGTSVCVKELQSEYNNLFLLNQPSKQGLASAYIDGFKWCLEKEYDVIIQMDSDMQHPPEILPSCIQKIKENDVIVASRYIKDGKWSQNPNYIKQQISFIGNLYSKIILSCPIKDMTGGYNIWSRKALESINLDKIISKGYLFQIEMKYHAFKNNMKIFEYPYTFRKRANGKSKMDFKIILEAIILIWKIKNSV